MKSGFLFPESNVAPREAALALSGGHIWRGVGEGQQKPMGNRGRLLCVLGRHHGDDKASCSFIFAALNVPMTVWAKTSKILIEKTRVQQHQLTAVGMEVSAR